MADYFLDSSVVGKLYHAEPGTPEVEAVLSEPGARHFISRLTLIEVQSVFAGKARTGAISSADFDRLRRRFLTDASQRKFSVVSIAGRHYQESERIIRTHGPVRSIRTLDALQLAVALDLRNRGTLDYLVCADQRLCAVAGLESISVINPEQP